MPIPFTTTSIVHYRGTDSELQINFKFLITWLITTHALRLTKKKSSYNSDILWMLCRNYLLRWLMRLIIMNSYIDTSVIIFSKGSEWVTVIHVVLEWGLPLAIWVPYAQVASPQWIKVDKQVSRPEKQVTVVVS